MTLIDRLQSQYNALHSAEMAAIEDARLTHTSMPPNYWQDRWKAEQKLRAGLAIEDELTLNEGRPAAP